MKERGDRGEEDKERRRQEESVMKIGRGDVRKCEKEEVNERRIEVRRGEK